MTVPGHDRGADLWLGRDDLTWNILLVARMRDRPSTAEVRERLGAVYGRTTWRDPAADTVVEGELADLLASLAETPDAERPVSVGVAAEGALVVRGHHAHVDGLGLLAVLRDLVDGDLVSSAAGVSARRSAVDGHDDGESARGGAGPTTGRHTAAPVARDPDVAGDVFTARRLDREVRTAPLAHAAVQAIASHNRERAGTVGRIALAVGVSTVGGHDCGSVTTAGSCDSPAPSDSTSSRSPAPWPTPPTGGRHALRRARHAGPAG